MVKKVGKKLVYEKKEIRQIHIASNASALEIFIEQTDEKNHNVLLNVFV